RAGNAVGLEAGPTLEPAQRELGVDAEPAVDCRGRKTVPREQELKGGDVPARGPAPERAAAENVSAVAPKRLAGCRADDPFGRQSARLEPHPSSGQNQLSPCATTRSFLLVTLEFSPWVVGG